MSDKRTLDLFPALPADRVWSDRDWDIAEIAVRRLFNPSQPINEEKLFSGRLEEVDDLLQIIYEGGAHAIIYGERGVGKSSLANTIKDRIPTAIRNIRVLKDNCRPEDTFFDLWSKMLFDFQYENVPLSDFLRGEQRYFVVNKILESLPKMTQFVIIFDEFDRVENPATKQALSDTIKHFSDYPQNITIVVVGVGFSIEELFGAHPSIERCCRQIPMPRMSNAELIEIIDERLPQVGLTATSSVKGELVSLSQGLPGYVHLAGREAAISALRRRSRQIEGMDVGIAIRESVRRAQESIINSYHKAIYSAKDNIYKEVLLACALAKTDERGKFSASDVRDALTDILHRRVEIGNFARHLAAFCDEGRGPILRKTGKPKRFQYQFINAPIQPYIIMAGKKDNLI